jgi:hypothetical protein
MIYEFCAVGLYEVAARLNILAARLEAMPDLLPSGKGPSKIE